MNGYSVHSTKAEVNRRPYSLFYFPLLLSRIARSLNAIRCRHKDYLRFIQETIYVKMVAHKCNHRLSFVPVPLYIWGSVDIQFKLGS